MPIEIEKEVTTKSSSPSANQVSQTSTVAQTPTVAEQQDAQSDRGNAWIWYLVGIVDLLLLLRLLFHLFGARAVGFASMLYGVTNWLAAPFKGIFPNPQVEGAYFDSASIAAIVVYILVGWAVSRLIDLATRPANSKKI